VPSLTKDHTLTVHNTAQLVTIPLDMYVLKTAALRCIDPNAQANNSWAQLAILSGGTDFANIVAFLSSGYIGPLTPVYWTGSLVLEADLHLAAIISGQVNAIFRLSCILWKVRLDEKGEFRADP